MSRQFEYVGGSWRNRPYVRRRPSHRNLPTGKQRKARARFGVAAHEKARGQFGVAEDGKMPRSAEAVAEALTGGMPRVRVPAPIDVLAEALAELRGYVPPVEVLGEEVEALAEVLAELL